MRILGTLFGLAFLSLVAVSTVIGAPLSRSWFSTLVQNETKETSSQHNSGDAFDNAELRAKIGQMILIGFPGTSPNDEWAIRVARMIKEGRIGGVVLFANNVVNPSQLRSLVVSLSAGTGSSNPFVCIDQEGGAIQRLVPAKGFLGIPSAQQIAQMEPEVAYQLYSVEARELSSLGINCNFGPVVDLNVNPNSPSIGHLGRSYSSIPEKVMEFGNLFIDAHRKNGVLTAVKHFPGHGSALADPHEQMTKIDKTWSPIELEPFRRIINENTVDMVMVGHLIHARFSDSGLPASLSKRAIQGELRGKLGYTGLIVTDDLDMNAIHNTFSTEVAAVMAIDAGADLVIVANNNRPDPDVANRVSDALVRAIHDGQIMPEAIDQSYRRIQLAKAKVAGRRAYLGMAAFPAPSSRVHH